MNRIIQSESYEEEIVKAVMEGVLEEKREKMEERRQISEQGIRGKMVFRVDSVTSDGNNGVSGERTAREN
ncbi:hypothetical protein NPIL_256501 [Nephila pilipes]|uniref:Uncharacterized protein n=1 Tax=Nephila pilipes TaxID=299642 RepID=A0A8X6QGF7_NEPPI|nr:hypothetical protein NPIL_256501 [Nephila pilipes]